MATTTANSTRTSHLLSRQARPPLLVDSISISAAPLRGNTPGDGKKSQLRRKPSCKVSKGVRPASERPTPVWLTGIHGGTSPVDLSRPAFQDYMSNDDFSRSHLSNGLMARFVAPGGLSATLT